MAEELVFTDRYGGHYPSVLRTCGGPCEGMGVYPESDPAQWPAGTRPLGRPEADGTPDDGWRFVRCPDCRGTGRVSWWVTLAHLPRWFWRALLFVRREWGNCPPHWTPQRHHRTLVRIAFWEDLRRLRA